MQGQQDSLVQAGSVQVPRNGLPRPAVQLQLLWVRRVGVWFRQDVAVAVLVEGVLQGVPMGGQTLGRKEWVAASSFGGARRAPLLLLLLAFGSTPFPRPARSQSTCKG